MGHNTPPGRDAEQALVRGIVGGAKEQFAVIVKEHQESIYALIMRQVGDAGAASDLAQETFIRAYKKLNTFKGESALGTWLIRIALNVTSSYFASRAFKDRIRNIPFEISQHDSPDSEDRTRHLSHEERHQLLRSFVAELRPKLRAVVALCGVEGKSYAEASDILGVPMGTIASRMHKAIACLRKQFEKAGL